MAVKTYYEYRDKDLLEHIKEHGHKEAVELLFSSSVYLLLPTVYAEQEYLELSNILARTLMTNLETDRFGILWNGDKDKIINGLSTVYLNIIESYLNNHKNLFDTKNVEIKYNLTFKERITMKEEVNMGVRQNV